MAGSVSRPRRLRVAGPLAAALLLAACAVTPVRQPVPLAAAGQAQALQARQLAETWLAAHPDWQLAGRVALADARNGGSGRLDWRQVGPRFDVTLTAPVTRQGWRLSGDAAGATLAGLDGGPRQGADAGALLHEATGWEIPVAALAYWVRGARADSARFGAARIQFDAGGQLVQLQQDGWTIDYTGWQPAGADGQPPLPLRLQARREDAKVRLVIDRWDPPAP